jgi:DNA-binding response OmpR family regulator
LVIDADRDIAWGVKLRLSAAGYRVFSAVGVAEGIGLTVDELPGVVLLDVEMPQEAGLTLLRYLQGEQIAWRIPVVAFAPQGPSARRALFLGAWLHIVKPYDSQSLLAGIRDVLGRSAIGAGTIAQRSLFIDGPETPLKPAMASIVPAGDRGAVQSGRIPHFHNREVGGRRRVWNSSHFGG